MERCRRYRMRAEELEDQDALLSIKESSPYLDLLAWVKLKSLASIWF